MDAKDFTEGGDERTMAAMWPDKSIAIGDALIGRISSSRVVRGKDGEYTVVVMEPAAVLSSGKLEGYASLAVSLSATLRTRIDVRRDEKKVFALVYKGIEGTGTNKYKVFDVVEQTSGKLRDVLAKAGAPKEITEALDLPF